MLTKQLFVLIVVCVINEIESFSDVCDVGNTRCYTIINLDNELPWAKARDACRRQGGELPPSIFDQDVQDGTASETYKKLLATTTTWISASQQTDDVAECYIHQTDDNGNIHRQSWDCNNKTKFVCFFLKKKVVDLCPEEKWKSCPLKEYIIEPYASLNLSCTPVEPLLFCEWRLLDKIYRSGSTITPGLPNVSISNGSCILTIPRVTTDYTGEWHCQAGSIGFVDTQLFFVEKPGDPVLRLNNRTTTELYIKEGQSMLVRCDVHGGNPPPTTTLTIEGDGISETLKSYGSSKSIQETGVRSTWREAKVVLDGLKYDGSVVSCTSVYKNNTRVASTSISLLYPPFITTDTKTFEGNPSEPLEIKITFQANPSPESKQVSLIVTTDGAEDMEVWQDMASTVFHNSTIKLTNAKKIYNKRPHQYEAVIYFSELQKRHTQSQYRFKVENSLGFDLQNFSVSIRNKGVSKELEETEDDGMPKIKKAGIAVMALMLALLLLIILYFCCKNDSEDQKAKRTSTTEGQNTYEEMNPFVGTAGRSKVQSLVENSFKKEHDSSEESETPQQQLN